jgi:hypothetical protein
MSAAQSTAIRQLLIPDLRWFQHCVRDAVDLL